MDTVRWNRNPAEAPSSNAGRQGASGGATATVATPEPPLGRAMTANPKLRALSACGYYDLVCSYAANVYLAGHLDADIARNVIARGYSGGHAVYTDSNAQMELKRDVVKFIQNAAQGPRRRPGAPPQK